MSPAVFHDLARRWRRRTLVREALGACGSAALGAALVLPWARSPASWVALAVLLLGALTARLRALRPWLIGPGQVAAHLNRAHPELEESCALALRAPGTLTVPERLQLQRLDTAWTELGATHGTRLGGAPVGFWRRSVAGVVAGGIALTLTLAWRTTHPPRPGTAAGPLPTIPATDHPPTPPTTPPRPRLTGVEVQVVPPGYTGHPPRTVAGLDATVEEGATITWTLHLDGPAAAAVSLVLGENSADTLPLHPPASGLAGAWEGARVVGAESGLYRVTVQPPDGPAWTLPEVGFLKVLRDAPPAVTILTPGSARTEFDPAMVPPEGLPVAVHVADDYGVRGAWLMATVAKGSGEGVKFRERRVEFYGPPPADGSSGSGQRDFTCRLDLPALGLEPGDELYFHAEAEDNHPPSPHASRSETRFVVLRGPESVPVTAGRGMAGVNLVPEYFRSERQIILDTERLLTERPGLSEREFRRRSEDLGTDQALLRLRYGQFVGEESEAGVGGGGDHTETNLNPLRPGVPAGVPSDLVHRHDAGEPVTTPADDPRAGLRTAMRLRLEHADQARGGGGHDDAPHPPDTGLPPTAAQIVSPYVDQHDSQEKATFFDHNTKATLRGVLAEMWTAEGLLRTGRPGEALEPEHRALDGLKELQQGERLYVQRVGFEPAPLRVAERRGRGDVADVPARATATGTTVPENPALAAVRAALAILPGGNGGGGGRPLTPQERGSLAGAGEALSAGAAARPEEGFLEGLRALRRLEAAGGDVNGDLATVRAALLRLLPPVGERPVRPPPVPPTLLVPAAEPTPSP